jgi:hypothetical protein
LQKKSNNDKYFETEGVRGKGICCVVRLQTTGSTSTKFKLDPVSAKERNKQYVAAKCQHLKTNFNLATEL